MSIIEDVFGQGFEKKERVSSVLELTKLFDSYLSNKEIPVGVVVEVINRVMSDLYNKDKSFAKLLSEKLILNHKKIHEQYHFTEFK